MILFALILAGFSQANTIPSVRDGRGRLGNDLRTIDFPLPRYQFSAWELPGFSKIFTENLILTKDRVGQFRALTESQINHLYSQITWGTRKAYLFSPINKSTYIAALTSGNYSYLCKVHPFKRGMDSNSILFRTRFVCDSNFYLYQERKEPMVAMQGHMPNESTKYRIAVTPAKDLRGGLAKISLSAPLTNYVVDFDLATKNVLCSGYKKGVKAPAALLYSFNGKLLKKLPPLPFQGNALLMKYADGYLLGWTGDGTFILRGGAWKNITRDIPVAWTADKKHVLLLSTDNKPTVRNVRNWLSTIK